MGLSPKAREFFKEAGARGIEKVITKYGKDFHKKIRRGVSGKKLLEPLEEPVDKV